MWHSVAEEMRDKANARNAQQFWDNVNKQRNVIPTKDPRVFISTEPYVKENKALDKQVGGDHYKTCAIQPVEYIEGNKLGFLEGNVIKYVTRHSKKNGRADLEKARHYIDLLLELRYGEKSNGS